MKVRLIKRKIILRVVLVSNQLVNVQPRRDIGAVVCIGDSPDKKEKKNKKKREIAKVKNFCHSMSWIYAHTCIHTCVCALIHVCVYIYIYTPTNICVHTYLHTHTYTHIYMWQDELDSAYICGKMN